MAAFDPDFFSDRGTTSPSSDGVSIAAPGFPLKTLSALASSSATEFGLPAPGFDQDHGSTPFRPRTSFAQNPSASSYRAASVPPFNMMHSSQADSSFVRSFDTSQSVAVLAQETNMRIIHLSYVKCRVYGLH